jgi:pimeloyl-ACP methyl ester carboxylesterase
VVTREGEWTVPTVFLHPIGLDAHLWDGIAGPGDIALDFPGFGGTRSAGPPTFPGLADFVAGRLTEPADLVGVSLGSMVAQHTALLRPELVRSIVVACGGPATSPETSLRRARDSRALGMAGMLDSTLERWFTPEALADPAHPGVGYARQRLLSDDAGVFADYWQAMADHDVRDQLARIGVPTTVIAADGDRSVPVDAMRAIADAVPGATFEVIDGPHILPLENRDGFLAALGRHLDRVRA